ncbi:MAG: methyltransferase domain-containing protein [Woeseiaceae bacterium]|nr:methyltransferase domain-containing protein [Woeseiaceae bacterium]
MDDRFRLKSRDVRRRFDRAADTFDAAAFAHGVTRDGLLARMQPLRIDAKAVLDLGAATGSATPLLQKRFRRAHVVSLDLSRNMLLQRKRRRSWFTRTSSVQADAVHLPFADAAFDVVFANQLLPWVNDHAAVFAEITRVLQKGGVLAFATLGPDSFRQLLDAWGRVDGHAHANQAHVQRFPDMHDIGDALLRAGLVDPVLDVDRLTVKYPDAHKLFRDLTLTGSRNSLAGRRRGLLGKQQFNALVAALSEATPGAGIEIELELVYGHCWSTGPRKEPGHFHIDATAIPRRR